MRITKFIAVTSVAKAEKISLVVEPGEIKKNVM